MNPRATARASSAEPVSVVIALSAASATGSSKSAIAERTAAIDSGGCVDMHDPGAEIEARAQRLRRPGEDGIEGEPLTLGQLFRLLGAVAEEIGARVA